MFTARYGLGLYIWLRLYVTLLSVNEENYIFTKHCEIIQNYFAAGVA